MILSFLFYAFVCYLVFKLVFNFIIPVYRTTRQVKQGFRNMQQKMQEQQQPQQRAGATTTQKTDDGIGEYIDFEEIKD